MELKISQTVQDGIAFVRLEGALDSTTSAALQAAIMPAAGAPSRLAIDFNRVGYVSSAGLRVILSAAKQAHAAGGALAIFGLTNPVRETFEISGFPRMITIADTEADAIRGLG